MPEVYEGEGGATLGGDDSSLDTESWLSSVLFDMNIDPMIELGESTHPNTSLFDGHPNILNKIKDEMAFRVSPYHGKSFPKVHPENGVMLSGKYAEDDLMVSFNPDLFDICKLTLLLRVFVDHDAENVVTFGESYRWLGLFKDKITFNNQDQQQSMNVIKDDQWNEVLLTFSYDRESKSGKCLLVANGNEVEASVNAPLDILSDGERTIARDSAFSFVNYSNARCFKGIVGSAVLLNKASSTFSELREVGKLFLTNHKKPQESLSVAATTDIEIVEPYHIESEEQFNKLLKKNRLLVLDFFATWCCPCMAIAPKFSAFANKYRDVAFVKIDVDTQSSIMSRYNVQCMPTFCFIKDGVEIDRIEGADSKSIEIKVKSLLELLE